MKNLLICFSAGCLGALINSLVAWQFGEQGITRWIGVSMAPALTPAWLYPRIVWGGIWGLMEPLSGGGAGRTRGGFFGLVCRSVFRCVHQFCANRRHDRTAFRTGTSGRDGLFHQGGAQNRLAVDVCRGNFSGVVHLRGDIGIIQAPGGAGHVGPAVWFRSVGKRALVAFVGGAVAMFGARLADG
jgi:hypothetical protein